ncbi:MAG TPA: HD domain-containing protein [Ktedonobacterales bacterium]|nr:HD domain-containing protein [Ktedonobacterales bacterium]
MQDETEIGHAGQFTQRLLASARIRPTRVGVFADPLYDVIPVAQWVEDLLATAPFKRLAGISLSNAPGDLLFEWRFPSRLEHSIGAYHLARLARPRDRAIQAAALAHDLGHGPFSHLSETLMRERLGLGHEARSAILLRQALAEAPRGAMRRLAWLDLDEVTALIVGDDADARSHLLNGLLDYDNIDNIARFLVAGELGDLSYDPITLARALRLVAPAIPADPMPTTDDVSEPGRPEPDAQRAGVEASQVMLLASAEDDALGWRTDRAKVYRFTQEEEAPLAIHEMVRKAVERAAALNLISNAFFDLTDDQALRFLEDHTSYECAQLIAQVRAGRLYQRVWQGQASLPLDVGVTEDDGQSLANDPLLASLGDWRKRLALEARLAAETGLLPHEVIVSLITSSAGRALPPLVTTGQLRDLRDNSVLRHLPRPSPPRRMLSVFAAGDAGRDYRWRLRAAAERHLGAFTEVK